MKIFLKKKILKKRKYLKKKKIFLKKEENVFKKEKKSVKLLSNEKRTIKFSNFINKWKLGINLLIK